MTSSTCDRAISELELFGEAEDEWETEMPGAQEADQEAEEFFRKVAKSGRRRRGSRRSGSRGLRRVGVNAARAVLSGLDDLPDDDDDDDEGEFEWEDEAGFFNGLSPIRRVYPDAMIEHMAHMASMAETEFEAEELMLPVVPMIASKLAPLEMMAAPAKGKPGPSHGAAPKPHSAAAPRPAGARPHAPGARPHAAGARPHAPGARPHAPGARPHAPGARPHAAGARPHHPGIRPHAPGVRPHAPGMRPHHPGIRPHHPGAMRHGVAHHGGLRHPHVPTSRIGHNAYAGVMRVAPALTKGIGHVTRALHRNPATRPLVRVVPTIARKAAATIARHAAHGRHVSPKAATKILARHTAKTICKPGQCVHAYRRGKALDKHLHHTHPHIHGGRPHGAQGHVHGATPAAPGHAPGTYAPAPAAPAYAPVAYAPAAPAYAPVAHAPAPAAPTYAAAPYAAPAPTGQCHCSCTCPRCGRKHR